MESDAINNSVDSITVFIDHKTADGEGRIPLTIEATSFGACIIIDKKSVLYNGHVSVSDVSAYGIPSVLDAVRPRGCSLAPEARRVLERALRYTLDMI